MMLSLSKTYYIKSLKGKSTLRKKGQGLFYICVVCNRNLHKQTFQIFGENKYQVETSSVFDYMVCSADGKQYICITCHKKLLKGTVPAQIVCHNLQIFELPSRFRDLEKIIVAKRLLFKKVTIMPIRYNLQCSHKRR